MYSVRYGHLVVELLLSDIKTGSFVSYTCNFYLKKEIKQIYVNVSLLYLLMSCCFHLSTAAISWASPWTSPGQPSSWQKPCVSYSAAACSPGPSCLGCISPPAPQTLRPRNTKERWPQSKCLLLFFFPICRRQLLTSSISVTKESLMAAARA